jgi:hypothetical protein
LDSIGISEKFIQNLKLNVKNDDFIEIDLSKFKIIFNDFVYKILNFELWEELDLPKEFL